MEQFEQLYCEQLGEGIVAYLEKMPGQRRREANASVTEKLVGG
jgi:hypothetical protein